MTSWERSRFIPWTRLNEVSVPEYEHAKEQVYRSLNRDAIKEKESVSLNGTTDTKNGTNTFDAKVQTGVKTSSRNSVEYSTPDLVRSLAFGASIGSITGAVFGFMDGMRSAGESTILKNASNMAKGKFLMQGTTRAGATFGLFFSGFHGLKYGIRVAADPGVIWEMVGAGVLSLGALTIKPAMRVNIPYAGMLIGMDAFSYYMRVTD